MSNYKKGYKKSIASVKRPSTIEYRTQQYRNFMAASEFDGGILDGAISLIAIAMLRYPGNTLALGNSMLSDVSIKCSKAPLN